MCDLDQARFVSMFHTILLADTDSIPLDIWMEQNISPDYRVITVMRDKIVTDDVVMSYHILLELIR